MQRTTGVVATGCFERGDQGIVGPLFVDVVQAFFVQTKASQVHVQRGRKGACRRGRYSRDLFGAEADLQERLQIRDKLVDYLHACQLLRVVLTSNELVRPNRPIFASGQNV